MRKLVLMLAVAALAAALLHLAGDRQALARARADKARLAAQRDTLLAIAGASERERANLATQRTAHERTIALLLDSIAALDAHRTALRLSVREIRTSGALLERLRTTFPEPGPSGFALATLPLPDGDTLGLEYLLVPAFFAETFLLDHHDAEIWRREKDHFAAAHASSAEITTLQDSIARLLEREATAYRAGYDTAYESYLRLWERYRAELAKPRIKRGSLLAFILGAGTGMLAAELIHEE